MKKKKHQYQKSQKNTALLILDEIQRSASYLFLFGMLGLFPIYAPNQYDGLGNAKYDLFWKLSIFLIIAAAVTGVIKYGFQFLTKSSANPASSKQTANPLVRALEGLSNLDYAVFLYGICVILSYAFSNYKEETLRGAAGWDMGLYSQLLFVALYFILSRQKLSMKLLLMVHMVFSGITFLLGILHRFDVDILGFYPGVTTEQKKEFLSTMGQATWFSSYICVGFALGVIVFYLRDEIFTKESKFWFWFGGIYSVVSFGILVTQNSDSAFIALGGILLLLGYFSLSSRKRWVRFLELLTLMWGSFTGIGILQRIFADRAIPLDSLSVFFSQSPVIWVLFILSAAGCVFYKKTRDMEISGKKQAADVEKSDKLMQKTAAVYKLLPAALTVGIAAAVIFIYLNTKGYLLTWFGYQSTHPYLLFDEYWGSNRGRIWRIAWEGFQALPFYQKLFGVGPDGFSAYIYDISQYGEYFREWSGSIVVTNAHNEYLNSLLCYGIVGLGVWCAVLIGGIKYFYEKAKEQPYLITFALCITGYACHNFFCYQQVCCSPFLFIFIGLGEGLTKFSNARISVYKK